MSNLWAMAADPTRRRVASALCGVVLVATLAAWCAQDAGAASCHPGWSDGAEQARAWSQFRGGNEHNGAWVGLIHLPAVTNLWIADGELDPHTQPAVSADGEWLFAYSAGSDSSNGVGELKAFRAATGDHVWTAAVASDDAGASHASPICADGYVYWAGGSASTTVYRINATNGSSSAAAGGWTIDLGAGGVRGAGPTISGPHLFISTYGGEGASNSRLHALRASDGNGGWTVARGGPGRSAVAYDPARRTVCQMVSDGGTVKLSAFDSISNATSFTATWSVSNRAESSTLVCVGDRLYVQDVAPDGSGLLHVADAADNGKRLQTLSLEGSGPFAPAIDVSSNVYACGSSGGRGWVQAFDPGGDVLWTTSFVGEVTGSPVLADDCLFVGNQWSNSLVVLQVEDGAELARVPGCGPVAFGVSAFYSIGSDGRLYAYSTGTHSIEAAPGPSGSLSPQGRVEVRRGGEVTFRTGPELVDLVVDGVSVGAATHFTFTNVVAGHTVAAVFRDPFADAVVYSNALTQGPFLNHFSGNWDDPEAVLGKVNTLDHDDNEGWSGDSPMRKINMVTALWWGGTTNPAAEGKVVAGMNNGVGLMGPSTRVTVALDPPVSNDVRNPFGVDLLVFGNSRFASYETSYSNTDMARHELPEGHAVSEPQTVSVAQSVDGPWYTYTNAFADDFFPLNPWRWEAENRCWADQELEMTRPVDPWLATPAAWAGKSVAAAVEQYGGSAGGGGFDLADSGFEWVRYVKVSGTTDSYGYVMAGEVTGFSDVSAYAGDYWLDVGATGGGGVDATSRWVRSGERVSVTASAGAGTVFRGWRGELADVANTNAAVVSFTMNRPRRIVASFGLPRLTVVSAHGSSDPAPGTYDYAAGRVVTNRVWGGETNDGTRYVCSGWTLLGGNPSGGVAADMTLTLTNDAVLTWQWWTQHWLDVVSVGHGTVTPGSDWYDAETNLQLLADAAPYYHLLSWTGDVSQAGSTQSAIHVTVDGSHAVGAVFAANTVTNGTPEWWLARYGLMTNGLPDEAAVRDLDEDGARAWQEYYAGTDPWDDDSVLRIVDVSRVGGSNRITWVAGTNGAANPFSIHALSDLASGGWTVVATNLSRAAGVTNRWWQAGEGAPLFFRIGVEDAP